MMLIYCSKWECSITEGPRLRIWKGYHGQEAKTLVESAWREETFLGLFPPHFNTDSIVFPESPQFPQKPILAIPTSGSTQRPRLVIYSKENIESSVRAIYGLFDLPRIKKVFCFPQPYHTFGLTLGYGAQQIFGFELITPEGKYSRDHQRLWLETADEETLTLGTPTHFKDLRAMSPGRRVPQSYACIIGGALATRQDWWACKEGLQIECPSIGYGASEASPGITHLEPGVPPEEDGEIGSPLPQVQVQVSESGLEFSGPSLCLALLEEGQLRFPQSHWLRDRVEIRSDGQWVYRGRIDWTLNRGGTKISLENLDRELDLNFGFRAMSVALPHDRLGQDLGVLVEVSEGDSLIPLIQYLREKYQLNFDARNFVSVPALPLNSNQKLDRAEATRLVLKERDKEGLRPNPSEI